MEHPIFQHQSKLAGGFLNFNIKLAWQQIKIPKRKCVNYVNNAINFIKIGCPI
jgi:hypothetical protein